jgi:hypothetical protein
MRASSVRIEELRRGANPVLRRRGILWLTLLYCSWGGQVCEDIVPISPCVTKMQRKNSDSSERPAALVEYSGLASAGGSILCSTYVTAGGKQQRKGAKPVASFQNKTTTIENARSAAIIARRVEGLFFLLLLLHFWGRVETTTTIH